MRVSRRTSGFVSRRTFHERTGMEKQSVRADGQASDIVRPIAGR